MSPKTESEKTGTVMREFWNEKARENPMYYISSIRDYDDSDEDEFWKWGRTLGEQYLDESGISFSGNETALDIGCGIGRMTAYLAGRFHHVIGLDVSEEMIEQAREKFPADGNAEFRVGNGTDLSVLDDESFDFVFSYICFQHIPDAEITLNYIREIGRVLRPGGHSHFQVNNTEASMDGLRAALKRVYWRWFRRDSGGPQGLDSPAWRGSRLTLSQIESACNDSGQTVVKLLGEGLPYLWVTTRKS